MRTLDHFREIFPSLPLIEDTGELRYLLRSEDAARITERCARQLILEHGLPLIADAEKWESRGMVREIAVVVRAVPDPMLYDYADECGDTEPEISWWEGSKSEE